VAYEPGVTGPPGTWQAKVFLAYASEDRKVALAVQEAITEGAIAEGDGTITVVKWDVNAELTDSIFNNILSTMSGTDFGVFLYSPVDYCRKNIRWSRATSMEFSDLNVLTMSFEIMLKIIAPVPPAYQGQPAAEHPQSAARTGQPLTAEETYSRGVTSLAALGKLTRVLEDPSPGRIVVHATYGIGRIMGFDPEGAKPRYVDVQLESGIGRYKTTELFEAPTGL